MKDLKDARHLLRLVAVFAAVFAIFLLVRSALVPRGFGKYGHYRAEALAEAQAKPIHYAGHQACENCHGDITETKSKGRHKGVNCESCHGPLENHVEDPGSVQPAKLETPSLCPRCHTANAAKPKAFPQVVPEDHSGGVACDTCHKPHAPTIEAEAAEVRK
jgi:hypothetical protein